MSQITNNALHDRLVEKQFIPANAAEVGVYHPETSNIYQYILANIPCTLVEPDPKSVQLINEYFPDRKNITLEQVAVCDYSGTIDLIQRGASTFASNLPRSPSMVNDEYALNDSDRFSVKAVTFDALDKGDIDLLSIDIEGGEWFVLKHMQSRPRIISVETHGAAYVNPFITDIRQWMKHNQYELWYKDKADSVYVHRRAFRPTFPERLKLKLYDVYLLGRRFIKLSKLWLRKALGIRKKHA